MWRTLNAVIVAATGICVVPLAQSATISMTAELVLHDYRGFQPDDSIIGSSASGGTVSFYDSFARIDMHGGFTSEGQAAFQQESFIAASHRWRHSFIVYDSIANTTNEYQPATFDVNIGGGFWYTPTGLPASSLVDTYIRIMFNDTVVASDHVRWTKLADDPGITSCVYDDQDVGVLSNIMGCGVGGFDGPSIDGGSYQIHTNLAPGQMLSVSYEYTAETLVTTYQGLGDCGFDCVLYGWFSDPMILRLALDEPVGGNLPEPGTLALIAGGFALVARTRVNNARRA